MNIELFGIDDYDSVYALWMDLEGIGLSDADSRQNLQRYLDRNPGMSFICRMDGLVVGAVLCGHDGRRGYIHHLGVSKNCQNRGIGRELLGACLDALRQAGIAKCHVFVFRENSIGKSFWEKAEWLVREDLSIYSKEIDAVNG